MPSGVPLNDTISSHFTVPSPGAVNDKLRAFFDQWYFGEGSPEGVVTAPTGSLYLQKNGTTEIIWQKQSGSGNTGWGALGSGTSPALLRTHLPDASNFAAWEVANGAAFVWLETLTTRSTFRYVRFRVGVQSGSVQVGVVRLSGAGRQTFARVMNSGIIACPSPGAVRVDCGLVALDPGEYAAFLWADNTTLQVSRSATGLGLEVSRHYSVLSGIAAGVPASGTLSDNWSGTRSLAIALEGDI